MAVTPAFDPMKLAAWSGGEWRGGPPSAVTGVCNDTRTIRRGNLYIALRGERLDGHAFVKDALAGGASGAVVSADAVLPEKLAGPVLVVKDTLRALQDMASGYRRELSALVIGVTGSAGKTTVKDLILAMLRETGPAGGTSGNMNNHVGAPLSLLSMEPGMVAGVFELGTNHPGEIEALCRIVEPSWGVITNIGPVHIGNFGAVDAIALEKSSLVNLLPAEKGLAVLDMDGDHFDFLRDRTQCRAVTVSLRRRDADFRCTDPDAIRDGLVAVSWKNGRKLLRTNLRGRHNVVNLLLAVAAAREYGVPWEGIEHALSAFKPASMRWEEHVAGGVRVINDAYNANPLSMRAALRAFADEQTNGRKWLLLSGMLELGEFEQSEHRSLGAEVASYQWAGLIVVGPTGALIADGAVDAGFPAAKVFRCADNTEAADMCRSMVAPGESLLLKASRGMKLEEVLYRLNETQEVPSCHR